jgi:3-hydroxybutyryl-CoA dehydrogenase
VEREIAAVGVVGLGQMGAGIAEVFARSAVTVTAVEIGAEALERGRANLAGSLAKAVARGKLSEADRDAVLGRVTFAVGLDALAEADLVIEAVPERLEIKRELFGALDRVCKPGAILATNTSSLPVTEIAVATGRPGRVLGMHFFNPAPVMKLVEVVRTIVTDDDAVAEVRALCDRLGKVAVTIGDRAGFVANALLFGYLNQAVAMFAAGHVSREDLDAAMKLGCGLPMGPLTLIDLIGLDTAYEILDTMYRRGGRNHRHAPAPLLREMDTAGLLGRKSGRGFYDHARPPAPASPASDGAAAGTVGKLALVGLTEELAASFSALGSSALGSSGSSSSVSGSSALGSSVSGSSVSGSSASGFDVRHADVPAGTLAALGDASAVVVGTPEPELLGALDAACKPGTLLAIVVADRPVIGLAMATGRPEDVVGLHFVGSTDVVEVVRTVRTSAAALDAAIELVRALGKHPVTCGDRAGLVVDALLYPYLNDAVKMVEAGYSTPGDIDNAMRLGCGYPAGPFATLDAAGPARALAVLRSIYAEHLEPGLAPAPLLEQMVTADRRFAD